MITIPLWFFISLCVLAGIQLASLVIMTFVALFMIESMPLEVE